MAWNKPWRTCLLSAHDIGTKSGKTALAHTLISTHGGGGQLDRTYAWARLKTKTFGLLSLIIKLGGTHLCACRLLLKSFFFFFFFLLLEDFLV